MQTPRPIQDRVGAGDGDETTSPTADDLAHSGRAGKRYDFGAQESQYPCSATGPGKS